MNIVKKFNFTLIAMIMLFGFLFSTLPASASSAPSDIDSVQQKQVLFSKEPITDEAVLYDLAKKGKTDLASDKLLIKDLKFNEKLNKEFNIKSYVTTQKLKEVRKIDAHGKTVTEDSYATTIFTDISPQTVIKSGSTYIQQPAGDTSVSVRCTQTIYYSYRTDYLNSIYWYSAKLDKVTSKWDVLDSKMTIKNGYVRGTTYGYKVTSFDPHSEGALITHRGTASGEYNLISSPISGATYTYTPYWSDYVNVYPFACHVGGQTDILITRTATGSQWIFPYPLKVNYTMFP